MNFPAADAVLMVIEGGAYLVRAASMDLRVGPWPVQNAGPE
jgi:hypothetical protein